MCSQNCCLKVQQDFFSFRPVKSIIWKEYIQNTTFGTIEWQKNIFNNTLGLDLLQKYPIRTSYQLAFLKHLIFELENNSFEVITELYDKLSELFLQNDVNEHYVHYIIKAENHIDRVILKEKIHYISQGTTGLCSWEASKALSQWAINNNNIFNNKIIFELGSGIGLAGIIITLFCTPKKFIFSDCHPKVLEMLQTNVSLNMHLYGKRFMKLPLREKELLQIAIQKEHQDQESIVSILELPWEEIDNKLSDYFSPDIVIAADIIYDKSLFPILIKAFNYFINFQRCELIIAATQRNEDTWEDFLNLLNQNKMEYNEIQAPIPINLTFSIKPIIKLFKIKNK